MNNPEILQKLRDIYKDCQQEAVKLMQHHPSQHHGFVADMQFASTYGAFLAQIKMTYGVDIENDSIAQKLIKAMEKTDTHTISEVRKEMYAALDDMKPEQMPSYIFLSCFPSVYKAMADEGK